MDFLERNLPLAALLLLLGGTGTALGLAGRAWRKTPSAAIGAGSFALLFALVCLVVGWAQREALLRAVDFVKTVPGLSHADREAMLVRKVADARAALGLSFIVASAPLAAGVLAISRGLRARARARTESGRPFV